MPWSRRETVRSELWAVRSNKLNKTWDFQRNSHQNWQLNLLSIVTDSESHPKNRTHTNNAFKNCLLKTQVLDRKWGLHKKTWDCQREQWTSCKVSSNLYAHKTINWNASLTSSAKPKCPNMRTKSQFFPNKSRDSTVSLNARTLILAIYNESWVKLKAWIRPLAHCRKRSRNSLVKTLQWTVRYAMLNKTSDFLRAKTAK